MVDGQTNRLVATRTTSYPMLLTVFERTHRFEGKRYRSRYLFVSVGGTGWLYAIQYDAARQPTLNYQAATCFVLACHLGGWRNTRVIRRPVKPLQYLELAARIAREDITFRVHQVRFFTTHADLLEKQDVLPFQL